MFRYKILIEYDGCRFHGWQRQDGVKTVQASIEDALCKMVKHETLVEGAGRTDAGVHATGQVGHFDLLKFYDCCRLLQGMNHYLRNSGVVIVDVKEVPLFFHARFSAINRTYNYCIANRQAPLALDHDRAWHVMLPLDVALMREAAQIFVGHHDFSAFRASACQSKTPHKTVTRFDIETAEDGQKIKAIIEARSFLHNQVRIMMGTLKLVGRGKLTPSDLKTILETGDRTLAGPTAPPHGLYLVDVGYKTGSNIDITQEGIHV
ncbi:MAG: tRNA pseudouridine(38-40) synthase TruA [Alphaproteobacteria bacterium]|nr:tRNA pseudouridine(38-40) synthase TruA [Alphaproteobacteria bacterium]